MAASPAAVYRGECSHLRVVEKAVPRVAPRTHHPGIGDPLDPARGILFGLLLGVPFWIGLSLVLF